MKRLSSVAPAPDFRHLIAMTDERGTFEHALFDQPRIEHGYCTDDMARVLVVTIREPDPTSSVDHLVQHSLRFLFSAQSPDGMCHNRLSPLGHWDDSPGLDDCWGRSLWGLGTAASQCDSDRVRAAATAYLERAAAQRSPWPRAMSFAGLGAAELLRTDPDNKAAQALLADAADLLLALGKGKKAGWLWPEPRLTYANAVLPEAMLAAGTVLERPRLVERGLELLEWLLVHQSRAGHLSGPAVGWCRPGQRAGRPGSGV